MNFIRIDNYFGSAPKKLNLQYGINITLRQARAVFKEIIIVMF